MGGALVQMEPLNVGQVSKNQGIYAILCMGSMQDFMYACKGYDQALSLEVLKIWKHDICEVNKVRVEFNLDTIAEVIHVRNRGKELKRETKLKKLQEIEDSNNLVSIS